MPHERSRTREDSRNSDAISGSWSRELLVKMDERFRERMRKALSDERERRQCPVGAARDALIACARRRRAAMPE